MAQSDDAGGVDPKLGKALDAIDDLIEDYDAASTERLSVEAAELFGEERDNFATDFDTSPIGELRPDVASRPTVPLAELASPSELRARLQSKLKNIGGQTGPEKKPADEGPAVSSLSTVAAVDSTDTDRHVEDLRAEGDLALAAEEPELHETYSEDETAAEMNVDGLREGAALLAQNKAAPPATYSGPLAPAPTHSGPLAPPLRHSGPLLAPPPTHSGPLVPPPAHSGPLAPPPTNSGPLVPPLAYSGPQLPPLIPSEILKTRTSADPTAFGSVMSRPAAALSPGLAAAIPAVAGGVALLVVAAVVAEVWPSPLRGAVLFAFAGGLALALAALVANSRKGWFLHLAPALVVSAVAGVCALGWNVSATRALFVDYATEDVNTFAAVLLDDLVVASAGCARFAPLAESPEWFVRVSQAIEDHPALAASCLQAVPAETRAELVGSLERRWTAALYESDTPTGCEVATALSKLPLDPEVTGARLLECTLSGGKQARPCCAEALRATMAGPEHWPAKLRSAAPHFQRKSTSVDLFGLTLADQPTLIEALADLNVSGVKGQAAAFEVVCESIQAGDWGGVSRHVTAALAGQCDVDVARFQADEKLWPLICESTLSAIRRDPTLPPLRATCDHAEDAMVARAIETAQSIIQPAVVRRFGRRFSDGLDQGFATKMASGDVNVSELSDAQRRTYMHNVSRVEVQKKPWDNNSDEPQSIFGTISDARERPKGAAKRQ